MPPYDFQKDYALWKEYARRAHSRNFAGKKDVYVSLQSIVERVGHRKIAEAACDRSCVLEIGAGGGEHIEFEKNSLNDYTAVDIEPKFLELIKEHYPAVKAVQVAGSALPFPDRSFTTVIAASTLEHIPTLEETLAETRRVLTENGDFLVLVPRNGSLIVNLFKVFVTYPTLRLKGIRRPGLIWHYENANTFQRVRVLLSKYFLVKDEAPVPCSWMPEAFSPLHFFHCVRKPEEAGAA